MTIGSRVIVWPHWNSFCGQSGIVTATRPHLMVRLDGDTHAMRFSPSEIIEESSREHMIAGE